MLQLGSCCCLCKPSTPGKSACDAPIKPPHQFVSQQTANSSAYLPINIALNAVQAMKAIASLAQDWSRASGHHTVRHQQLFMTQVGMCSHHPPTPTNHTVDYTYQQQEFPNTTSHQHRQQQHSMGQSSLAACRRSVQEGMHSDKLGQSLLVIHQR
jgi:hypothetical protein